MQVWVPVVGTIVVALIAAGAAVFATRSQRHTSRDDSALREADLIVSGLSALVDDYREAYAACREELAKTREELARCLRGE